LPYIAILESIPYLPLLNVSHYENNYTGRIESIFAYHSGFLYYCTYDDGPGLLESIYHHCLVKKLRLRSLKVESMVPVPLSYRGEELNKTYIIDF
jgi:hypothetical protein